MYASREKYEAVNCLLQTIEEVSDGPANQDQIATALNVMIKLRNYTKISGLVSLADCLPHFIFLVKPHVI